MTCIVGVETDEGVWMGADSWADDGWGGLRRADPKMFEEGPYLIGFTTSYRMGQLLRFGGGLPVVGFLPTTTDDELFAFMATEFVTGVRTVLKDNGWSEKDKDRETGGEFLVAVNGRLFRVGPDYEVGRSQHRYLACGSGYMLAHGSLASSEGMGMEPVQRVAAALAAAERHCGGVCAPFHVHVQARVHPVP